MWVYSILLCPTEDVKKTRYNIVSRCCFEERSWNHCNVTATQETECVDNDLRVQPIL
jgi:hypothetical protein